jgi:hypothetical protein
MTLFKRISKTTATLGLTLLAAGFAHAQGPAATTGSTDIWATDFQKTFATGKADNRAKSASIGVGSTDIYQTDFQKAFPSDAVTSKTLAKEVYTGSGDFYSINFQKAFM